MTAQTPSRWRNHAIPIIARVLSENAGKPEKELRKLLRAAYPFGQYAYHPAKIWRDEINVQLGKKKQKVCRKGETLKPKPTTGMDDRRRHRLVVSRHCCAHGRHRHRRRL